MAEKRKSNPRFAVCVRNEGYEASLERNKLYVVLPDPYVDREVPKAVQESLLKAS